VHCSKTTFHYKQQSWVLIYSEKTDRSVLHRQKFLALNSQTSCNDPPCCLRRPVATVYRRGRKHSLRQKVDFVRDDLDFVVAFPRAAEVRAYQLAQELAEHALVPAHQPTHPAARVAELANQVEVGAAVGR